LDMVLSDRTIKEEIARGRIIIEPLEPACIQPASVDVRLDRKLLVFRNWRPPFYIDVKKDLEGKSSLGRIGLLIHSTAGYVDPGWRGHLTLELSNVAKLPITLYYGMKIGQISFLRLTTAAERLYGDESLGSKYQGQTDPTASRFYQDFERKSR